MAKKPPLIFKLSSKINEIYSAKQFLGDILGSLSKGKMLPGLIPRVKHLLLVLKNPLI